MTYDERIFVLIGELAKILEGYATPKHLNTRAKEEDEVRNIVRMLNQKFPNDTTGDHIRGTMDRAMLKLKEAHKSRSWPSGKLADKMVEMGLITEAHLQPYLEYLSAHNIPAMVDPPIS